jgi:hypothetical protein
MPEGASIEVAHDLTEKDTEQKESAGIEILEIMEAILLAVVAIATAWGGYQAATWDGKNALYYGEASRDRTTANKQATLGGQQLVYDSLTFNSWLQARLVGQKTVEAAFVHRFTPAYKIAFDAWLRTNPFHNPHAVPGPRFMPQYHNAQLDQSASLEKQASARFQQGTDAREIGDVYVRNTVYLASILFLVAISQRFKVRRIRRALLGLAFALLVVGLFALLTHPIA